MINLLNTQLISITQEETSEKVTFEVDKNSIKSIMGISEADELFDESLWNLVIFVYKHKLSKRRFTPSFVLGDSSVTIKMKYGMMSSDEFELKKIIISKTDRTKFSSKRVNNSQLSNYDFQLSVGSNTAPAPQIPQNISISLSSFFPSISFNASSNANIYKVYRGTSSNNLTFLANSSSTNYEDSSALKNQTYYYAVKASNGMDSNFSEIVSIITPLNAPALISQSVDSNGHPNISWSAILGASSYKLFKGSSLGSLNQIISSSNLSYIDTDVVVGNTYYYAVKSFNGSDSPSFSDSVQSTALPQKPSNLSISLVNGKPSLAWDSISGVTYDVFRSISENGSSTKIAESIEVNTYVDSSAVAGNTYYYSVSSKKNGVSSENTTRESASPYLLAPSNVSSSLVNAKPSLQWDAVSGATSYKIYGGTDSENLSLIGTSNSTSYQDSSAQAGINYYQIKASNGISDSASSDVSAKLVPPSVPSSPLISADKNSANLSWDAVSGANSYKVLRGLQENSLTVIASGVSSNSYSDTSVVSGYDYYYSIVSSNGEDSSPSNQTYVNIPLEAPSVAVYATNGMATLNWGSITGALSYKIYRGASSNSLSLIAQNVTDNYYDDSSVSAGSTYYYAVKSVDEVDSEQSTVVSVIIPVSAPSNLSITATPTQSSLSWNAVSGATSYKIYRGTTSGSLSQLATGVTTASYIDSSVNSETTYYYAVKSFNGSNSDLSSEISVAIPAIPPLAPTNLQAISTLSSLNLSWDAVSRANSYKVYRGLESNSMTLLASGVSSNSYSDTSAGVGKYYYAVSAYNGSESEQSASIMTDGKLPVAPVLGNVSQNFTTGLPKVELSWSSVYDSYVTYSILRSDNGEAFQEIATTSSKNYSDEFMSLGVPYSYMIKSVAGSNYSSGSNQKQLKLIDGSTYQIQCAGVSSTSIEVYNMELAGADSYDVFWGTSSGNYTNSELGIASDFTIYTINSLSPNTTYFLKMVARNSVGVGNSKELEEGSTKTSTITPVLSSLTQSGNNIVVDWDDVSGADSYTVYRGQNSSSLSNIATPVVSSYSDAIGSAGSTYFYGAKAFNGINSNLSGLKSIKKISTTSPTITATNPTMSSLNVSWDSVTGADAYDVEYKLSSASSYTKLSDKTSPASVTGLSGGKQYDVRVVSKNSTGEGNSLTSSVSNFIPVASVDTTSSFLQAPTKTASSAYMQPAFMVDNGSNYVAISHSSAALGVMTSSDGITWNQAREMNLVTGTTSTIIQGFEYLNGNYVICRSTGKISYNSDLGKWFEASPFTSTPTISSMAYGNSLYVAVTSSAPNGPRFSRASTLSGPWTESVGTTDNITYNKIIYANGKFVAVGQQTATASMVSAVQTMTFSGTPSSGSFTVSWNGSTSSAISYSATFSTMAASIQTALRNLTGFSTLTVTAVSTTWAAGWRITFPAGSGPVNLMTVNSSLATSITGSVTTTTTGVGTWGGAYSTNGTTWVPVNIGTAAATYSDVIWTGTRYVTVSSNGANSAYSTDGITWTASANNGSNNWRKIAYGVVGGTGTLVAVATSGTNRFSKSTDGGTTWTPMASTNDAYGWSMIGFRGGVFCALAGVNYAGISSTTTNAIATSTDGTTWTVRTRDYNARRNPLYSFVKWNGSKFVLLGSLRFLQVAAGVGSSYKNYVSYVNSDDSVEHYNTSIQAHNMTYGPDGFAVLGDVSGNIRYSDFDGRLTSLASTPSVNNYQSIAYGAGKYVAVSNSSFNRISTSTNGVTWTSMLSPNENKSWNSVIYAGSKFVAVGDNAVPTDIQTVTFSGSASAGNYTLSYNGTSTLSMTFSSTAATMQSYLRTASGISTLLVTGSYTTGFRVTFPSTLASTSLIAVAANTVTGSSGAISISVAKVQNYSSTSIPCMTSTDGNTWSLVTVGSNTAASYQSVCHSGSMYVTVGASGCFAYSNDAVTWTSGTITGNPNLRSVAFGNGVFVAVSDDTSSRVYTSTNGSTWTARSTADNSYRFSSIDFGGGRFMAVAEYSSTEGNKAQYSTDGITWTEVNTSSPAFYQDGTSNVQGFPSYCAYGNGLAVSVFTLSSINYVRVNGNVYATPPESLSGVVFDGSKFLSLGASGKIYSSTNGINWTFYTDAFDYAFSGSIRFWKYINGKYVLATGTGISYKVWYSDDAITWNSSNTITFTPYDIAFGNGVYVLTSSNYSFCISTSTDLINWTTRVQSITSPYSFGVPYLWTASYVVFENNMFVVGGDSTVYVTSSDGINWTSRTQPVYSSQGLGSSNGLIVMSTTSGSNYYSTNGVNWSVLSGILAKSALIQGDSNSILLWATSTDSTYTNRYYNTKITLR